MRGKHLIQTQRSSEGDCRDCETTDGDCEVQDEERLDQLELAVSIKYEVYSVKYEV